MPGTVTHCHLPQGRCGLKTRTTSMINAYKCHLPQGRCGLKYAATLHKSEISTSPSARKVWIEINCIQHREGSGISHLPQGRCGLKLCLKAVLFFLLHRHLPQGRCGLKCSLWQASDIGAGHLPQGRCGLKYHESALLKSIVLSPSARKVWIEIIRADDQQIT